MLEWDHRCHVGPTLRQAASVPFTTRAQVQNNVEMIAETNAMFVL